MFHHVSSCFIAASHIPPSQSKALRSPGAQTFDRCSPRRYDPTALASRWPGAGEKRTTGWTPASPGTIWNRFPCLLIDFTVQSHEIIDFERWTLFKCFLPMDMWIFPAIAVKVPQLLRALVVSTRYRSTFARPLPLWSYPTSQVSGISWQASQVITASQVSDLRIPNSPSALFMSQVLGVARLQHISTEAGASKSVALWAVAIWYSWGLGWWKLSVYTIHIYPLLSK